MKNCKAKEAVCRACDPKGYYEKMCQKSGNFKKYGCGKKKQAILADREATSSGYYDEIGNLVPASMNMLSVSNSKMDPSKDLVIKFGVGMQHNSIDSKIKLKIDTGADVNALNMKTFQKLFPNVQLKPSTVVLENFYKRLIRLFGSFKCFLRWKRELYRIEVNVMDKDDCPNVVSRQTTFLMGILKPCFIVSRREEKGRKCFQM